MRVQTIEYQCPHCGKKINDPTRGKIVAMTRKDCYGTEIVPCKKCKKEYRQTHVKEAALYLTRAIEVPTMMYSPKAINALLLILIPVMSIATLVVMSGYVDDLFYNKTAMLCSVLIAVAITFAIGAVILYILGVLTRGHRQKQKNLILKESQERLLNDDKYFMILLAGGRSREELLELVVKLPEIRAEMKRCFDADILPFLK